MLLHDRIKFLTIFLWYGTNPSLEYLSDCVSISYIYTNILVCLCSGGKKYLYLRVQKFTYDIYIDVLSQCICDACFIFPVVDLFQKMCAEGRGSCVVHSTVVWCGISWNKFHPLYNSFGITSYVAVVVVGLVLTKYFVHALLKRIKKRKRECERARVKKRGWKTELKGKKKGFQRKVFR